MNREHLTQVANTPAEHYSVDFLHMMIKQADAELRLKDAEIAQLRQINGSMGLEAQGQRLASQREDLIAAGVCPAELVIPLAPGCPTCGGPQSIPGEGRFCGVCQDYEGHCGDDHCWTCGADT